MLEGHPSTPLDPALPQRKEFLRCLNPFIDAMLRVPEGYHPANTPVEVVFTIRELEIMTNILNKCKDLFYR